MANALRGEKSFTADGRAYTVKFSINAICELEDALGLSVAELGTAMADPARLRIRMMRALLWAGLRDKHPEVTIEDAGRLLDDGATRIMPVVAEAFALAFPAEEKKGARPR